ncbi:hypothetical protein TSUD_09390 [Trifolium subterraneum]|nr:hypothetical protein TSUD_09390 [Trifolium subterraneum]
MLERIPLNEVFEHLKCSREGLTSEEGANRLQSFGPNKLEEIKDSKFLKFLGFMWNPLSWVMEVAAIMAIALANGGGKPPDWQDFVGVVVLLVANSTISFIEENNAGNAAAALMAGLAPKTKVLRDGKWSEQDAAILVPGDIISIKLGDIIPADARLLEGDPLSVDQSALTGESLPVTKGVDKDHVILLAARASRIENQDAIDAAIVGMLSDPQEARAGINEVHFLPFNPVEKRTALTYVDADGSWHRSSKGAPEQILELCNCRENVRRKAHAVIDRFAERGLRSLGVAYQEVPERSKDSPGAPWQFIGLLPLFDPPRHDSAETIRRALNLGVNVKMITGDQLAIGKETGRRLGMGTNMYPSSALLGEGSSTTDVPVDELIEKADGFAGVFPEHKYEIVRRLQDRKHICGMTGDGVNDAPALKRADIGIAVADATDAARSASDIVLTEPGLSVIISAVLTSRAIFQRMKNYTIYAVSITIRIVFGFMLIALIWRFDFSPFMVLIIAILNDGTIMTISKDRVKPSPLPDSWKLKEIFATGIVLGSYMALMTVIFYWVANDTNFFSDKFGVRSLRNNHPEMMAALYLQVSIISQALIFVTRSRNWSFFERPGLLLLGAFFIAQLTAFTTKKDYGREEREAQWAAAQRSLHGLGPQTSTSNIFNENSSYRELSEIAEQAMRRAEVARLMEMNTLKGRVESVVRLKGLDLDTSKHHYTI